jgi:hypothetical protein
LQGKPYAAATAALQQLGLRVEMAGFADDPLVPEGSVIRSRPSAGREVRKGRLVALLVSRGSEALTIPDLKTMLFDEAVQSAGARGMAVIKTGEAYTRVYAPGAIMLQDPPPDTPIAGRSTIEVLVSKGFPIEVSHPDPATLRLQFQVLPQWEREEVKVFVSRREDSKRLLYNQSLNPGASDTVLVPVSPSDVVEVYYGEHLAYSSASPEYPSAF